MRDHENHGVRIRAIAAGLSVGILGMRVNLPKGRFQPCSSCGNPTKSLVCFKCQQKNQPEELSDDLPRTDGVDQEATQQC